MSPTLRLGVAETDITPQSPIQLAGFARRLEPFEGITRPLFARAFFFSQDDPAGGTRRALLVAADLLWWGSDRIPELRRQASRRWRVPEDAIIFHGTHTHSGPQTSERFTPSLGRADPAYLAFLEARVLEAIGRAHDAQEPVLVERRAGDCRIGVNRRRPVPGGVEMVPDPDGPVEREVTVVRFGTTSGATKALLMHYACHPTTTMERRVSSEFPGVAVEDVKRALGDDVAIAYLQGCCGDINPVTRRADGVRSGADDDVRRLGGQLAESVLAVVHEPMQPLAPCPLHRRWLTVDLPFQNVPAASELEARRHEPGVVGEWCDLLLRNPERLCPSIPLELSRLDLAEGLSLLAMNAEVTLPFGRFVKAHARGRVLPLPYSNGMIGYVVTAEQLAQGGYEPIDSTPYFGLPSPFSPEIENLTKAATRTLSADHEDAPA